jgi:hypothetical protein
MAARRQSLNDPGTLVAQTLEGREGSDSDIVRPNREPSVVECADDDSRARVPYTDGPWRAAGAASPATTMATSGAGARRQRSQHTRT